MSSGISIGAFSEDQVSRLTGLSRSQLSSWRRQGFVKPSFEVSKEVRKTYNYIYSFKDLLTLRVVNQLRNAHGVSLQELRKVAGELESLGYEDFASKRLWVWNKRVVFKEPESEKFREISSKQFVANIPLDVVISDARDDIKKINSRSSEYFGKLEKRRQVVSSSEVFARTRIPVSVVMKYIKAGKRDSDIIANFPTLNQKDIDLARSLISKQAA